MARKVNARTVVNRQALTAIRAGEVNGMEALGQAIVARVHPPDDPATKARIPVDYGVWADGRKVAGGASKPHGTAIKQGVTLVVGVGFPGRFNEIGTSHQPARPFFTPEVLAELPETGNYLRPKVQAALRGVK